MLGPAALVGAMVIAGARAIDSWLVARRDVSPGRCTSTLTVQKPPGQFAGELGMATRTVVAVPPACGGTSIGAVNSGWLKAMPMLVPSRWFPVRTSVSPRRAAVCRFGNSIVSIAGNGGIRLACDVT